MTAYEGVQTSQEDFDLIVKIMERFVTVASEVRDISGTERITICMDLEVVHQNDPLDLPRMLEGNELDLVHDVMGIRRHLNRTTGKLEDFFVPRYSRMEDDDDTDQAGA